MLETDYLRALTTVLNSLTCNVALPSCWTDFSTKRGPLPGRQHEERSYARFHFPTRALLQMESTAPAPAVEALHVVLTKDLSRSGISFLHSLELFPGDRLWLWLTTGRCRYTVKRCVRHNDSCYEIGAQFAGEDT
jgi:hypothetical protein